MATIAELNAKQDRITAAIRVAEQEVSRRGDVLEALAVKITTAEKQRIYGKEWAAAKKRWEIAKRKLAALWKQSNANLNAIQRTASRKKNPQPSATAIQMKKVGENYHVYVGGVRVGSFATQELAKDYAKHLIKARAHFKKR